MARPDLVVVVAGPGRFSPGQTLSYTVTVKNDGFVAAQNTQLTLFLSPYAQFSFADHSGDYDTDAGTVTWMVQVDPLSTVSRSVIAISSWGLPQGFELTSAASAVDPIAATAFGATFVSQPSSGTGLADLGAQTSAVNLAGASNTASSTLLTGTGQPQVLVPFERWSMYPDEDSASWFVCQGYFGTASGTHDNNMGVDIVADLAGVGSSVGCLEAAASENHTPNRNVLSPVTGEIQSAYSNEYETCIRLDDPDQKPGTLSNFYLSLLHLDKTSAGLPTGRVVQGELVGKIHSRDGNVPGQGGVSHLHMELNLGGCESPRPGVPFSLVDTNGTVAGGNRDFRLDGYIDLPSCWEEHGYDQPRPPDWDCGSATQAEHCYVGGTYCTPSENRTRTLSRAATSEFEFNDFLTATCVRLPQQFAKGCAGSKDDLSPTRRIAALRGRVGLATTWFDACGQESPAQRQQWELLRDQWLVVYDITRQIQGNVPQPEPPRDLLERIDFSQQPSACGATPSFSLIGSIAFVARDPNAKVSLPSRYAEPGANMKYSVEYENEGDGTAYGVYVTDVLDDRLDDSTLDLQGSGTYDPATRTITWLIGEVPPHTGASFDFTISLRADVSPGEIVSNIATVYFPSVPETTPTNPVAVTILSDTTDIDGDGEPDLVDNCPTIANPDQADSDNNGEGNACDPGGALDSDGDGLADNVDNCVFDVNPGQENSDGDPWGDVCDVVDFTPTPTVTPTPSPSSTPTITATPTPTTTAVISDADADGVPDAGDNCPFMPNADQLNSDRNFVDLPATKPFDDLSRARSDDLGNACDPDDDNDGLADSDEDQLGPAGTQHAICTTASASTDPLAGDSDDDGVLDSAECLLGTDPSDPASTPASVVALDADGDGLPDALDPDDSDPDSDDDRVLDGIEFRGYHTDLLEDDSDGDGCADGKEIASLDALESVNAIDLQQAALSFGPGRSPAYIRDFDVNKDGQINSLDLQFIARQFGPC